MKCDYSVPTMKSQIFLAYEIIGRVILYQKLVSEYSRQDPN